MNIRIGRDKIVFLSYFLGLIISGSILLSLPSAWNGGGRLRYVDAIFTSTSAVCVTGLITVDTSLYSRFGQIVILALIQAGGLGLITFATLYIALPRRKISLLSRGFVGDYSLAEVEYRTRDIVRGILGITFGIEAAGAVLLFSRFSRAAAGTGEAAFDALFHAVSAFCNAGFSTFPTNLESYVLDPVVNFTVMILIVAGGLGFVVIRDVMKLLRGSRLHPSYHSTMVIRVTAVLIAAGAVAILFLEYDGAFAELPWAGKIMASLFASITPRTAGFDTVAPAHFGHGATLLTMILMFIGASPASTGGGIKTTTFFVVLIAAFRYHEGADTLHFRRRQIHAKTVFKAVGVVVKALLVVLVTVIAIQWLERDSIAAGTGPTLVQVLYESISAFATVGLSMGITASLGDGAKLALVVAMFVGRVGLFAMALPRSSRKIEGYATVPTGDVMVG